MKKTDCSKKILFSLAIIAVAFSVSACSNKTTEKIDENSVNFNESAGVDSMVDDGQPATDNSLELTAGSLDLEKLNETAEKPKTAIDDEITNKINTNTIMSPDQQEDLIKNYSQAIIKTNLGNITVKFYAEESPITVNNFLNLAKAGFYNGTKFHRVIKDFMIQGGDPLSKEEDARYWGTGGPGYKFADEFNAHKLVRGSLAMANSGSNTNGSQFFIVTLDETPWLDGKHTNFGQVISGMDIVDKIENTETGINDRPIVDVVINSIELVK